MSRLPATLARRRALKLLGGVASLPLSARLARAGFVHEALPAAYALRAGPAEVALLGGTAPVTAVWAYNGRVPGPMLRVRQGDTLRVQVANDLAEPTTVHWHGLRIPNAMDGVPALTQNPIAARGGTFDYAFACPDAGTFWYHPHLRGHVQVAMGLHGVLVVEEPVAPDVDRDVVWVLDDWRLTSAAQVRNDFDSVFDATHAGRLGDTVTVNGVLPDRFALTAGERVRIRLVNVANARIFALGFTGHAPYVIAHDGMPCEPYVPPQGRIVLGPGMRADIVLDAVAEPGSVFGVSDAFYANDTYEVLQLAYASGRFVPATPRSPADRVRLPPNPVPWPDLGAARRHALVITGGMMAAGMKGAGMPGAGMPGGFPPGGGMPGAGMPGMSGTSAFWALNGHAGTEDMDVPTPLFVFERGRTQVIAIANRTAWWHPIHLHGHSFCVLSRNGRALARRDLLDTTLLAPQESVEIAFVSDNPGDWMLHCHVLEHQATGMMATFRVA